MLGRGTTRRRNQMKKLALTTVLILLSFLVGMDSAAAQGGGHVKAVLNGYQEVVGPGSISTVGAGEFEARIDEKARVITYTLTYTVETPATQAHIHFAQRHVGGGVIAFLCGGAGKPPCPPGTADEAVVTGVITPADIIGPADQGIEPGSFDETVRAMEAGATYVNVHTTRWPAGEIRGQIADNEAADRR
jgi:hypothetical protein